MLKNSNNNSPKILVICQKEIRTKIGQKIPTISILTLWTFQSYFFGHIFFRNSQSPPKRPLKLKPLKKQQNVCWKKKSLIELHKILKWAKMKPRWRVNNKNFPTKSEIIGNLCNWMTTLDTLHHNYVNNSSHSIIPFCFRQTQLV